jgi:hypothetical protein
MRENQTIDELLEDCIRYFEQNCYTRLRIERYKSLWKNGICHYMEIRGIINYNRSVGEKFIHTRISSSVTPAERDLMRSVSVLTEIQETGKVSKRTVHPVTRELKGPIGEAIINYLKVGRAWSDSPNVFLSARAPYRPMTGVAVSNAVRQIIDASGIPIGQRRHGPHAMRHSLASRLLEHSVSLPVISESLGHEKTESTMTYLRIDRNSLRQCALDVPMVDASFYRQKGGAFYE